MIWRIPCQPGNASAPPAKAGTPNSDTNAPVKPDHGVRYTNDVVADTPLSIHVVEIERGRSEFEFCTTLGKGEFIGMGTVSEQVKTVPRGFGRPLAAINGDFYDKKEKEEGRPRDLQIRFGEVVSCPSGHTCFWMAPDGTPRMTNVFSKFRVLWPDGRTTPIGLNQIRDDGAAVLYTAAYGSSTHNAGGVELVLERGSSTNWLPLKVGVEFAARVREARMVADAPLDASTMVLSLGPNLAAHVPNLKPGAIVRIFTETTPDLKGVSVAIGGGPALVTDGKPMDAAGFLKLRHPRSAIGWSKDHIFLVEVDGRQSNISVGMTMPEIANYMVKLGCEQAMNFDGGGSATLWAFGWVKNSPSEGDERPAPNALVLVKKAAAKP